MALQSGSSKALTLFNDGTTSVVLSGNAALYNGDASTPLSITFQSEKAPTVEAASVTLRSGELAHVRISARGQVVIGAEGWLTISARSAAKTLVVRRRIEVPQPTPKATTWKLTSTARWPDDHRGGNLGQPLPLSAASAAACASLSDPTTTLVANASTATVTSKCVGKGLQLVIGDLSPGTYSGKLTVGSETVELEVKRTTSIWVPALAILIGIMLAVFTQGRTDQAWRAQQRFWLSRLPSRAANADAQYSLSALELPWEQYSLEQAVDEEVSATRAQMKEVVRSIPRLLRLLPISEKAKAAARTEINQRITQLEALIARWATMSSVFATARVALERDPDYAKCAPRLVERSLVILGAAEMPVTAQELAARCSEAAALPAALGVVDDLGALSAYLQDLVADTEPEDARTLAWARQYERQASAALAGLSDATKVVAQVDPLVVRGTQLASRLPKPAGSVASSGEVETAAVANLLMTGLSLPATFAKRVTKSLTGRGAARALSSGGFYAGQSVLIGLLIAIGVLSGLGVLYVGTAWGASWTDYPAALVWGYGSSTVLGSVVAAIRQLSAEAGEGLPTPSAK